MVLKAAPKTLTKKELGEAVYNAAPNLSRRAASQILDEFFEEIVQALTRNEVVKLSAFGIFKVQHKNERIGRNPKTGIGAVISSRRSVKFSAAPYVRDLVSGKSAASVLVSTNDIQVD